jgi:hypothetical protein
MTETPDFVITEGRAYHPGDVVLLRIRDGGIDADGWKIVRWQFDDIEAKTGLKFVLLSDRMEVVEPREDS